MSDPGILHVDLDAFYASVEQLADPALRGRPVVVGGLGPRGVVAAASYEARHFGIHSAMPMARARRACPDAAFLSPRFEEYRRASAAVMAILRDVTPLVEPISLDEAFLDVRGARRRLGSGPEIANDIRARVRTETGLVASVGVATTKLLAKLASDLAKPDGLLVVEAGTELVFLHPLEVRRLWGVGPVTQCRLAAIGVHTVGELAALPEATLVSALGKAQGSHLHARAWNRDERAVEPVRQAKSIGHEETFAIDVTNRERLDRELVALADRVASRVREAGFVGRTVQLKLRYADFRTITRSRTLSEPTDLAADLVLTTRELLAAVELRDGVRLLGVAVQQLEAATGLQGTLALPDPAASSGRGSGHEERSRRAALEHSVDQVRARYGHDAVVPARIAPEPPPS